MVYHNSKNKGLSLVEVIVVSALVLIFFGGFFAGVKYTLTLITDSKARLTALTVATDYQEYIRSLAYDEVGTQGGIPAGALPQVSTTTLNGIEFTRQVLVEYVDDSADGLGSNDHNYITTDYKKAKVTVNWVTAVGIRSIFLITNIIPRSIETDVDGGTLRVNVVDANAESLAGATVRLVNTTTNPVIDVSRLSNSEGVVLFGGAPAGSNYEIYVSKAGYSSDQTHPVSEENPRPNTQPVSVLEADITTMTFFIDELSSVLVRTVSNINYDSMIYTFANLDSVVTSSNVEATAGGLVLSGSAGFYASTGYADTATTTSSLEQWEAVTISAEVPTATELRTYVYGGTLGAMEQIPETVLPGNDTGFLGNYISLRQVPVASYPMLFLHHELSTNDQNQTPVLTESTIWYRQMQSSLAGEEVSLVGVKSIGQTNEFIPIPKHILSDTTDADGQIQFDNVEYDGYTASVAGSTIAEACWQNPLSVDPGTSSILDLLLVPQSQHSLRVHTKTFAGVPLIGAVVKLSRPGFSQSEVTSPCGQVYFGDLVEGSDYTLSVEPVDNSNVTINEFGIFGDGVELLQW